MRIGRNIVSLVVPIFGLLAAACTGTRPGDAQIELERARRAWAGNWHAVWQIEWENAPLRGPLVAEIWHAVDGRLRVETLEAPIAALNGLIRANDGLHTWLYDVRQECLSQGTREQLRMPLVDDMLEAMNWVLQEPVWITDASVDRWGVESGEAIALEITMQTGNRVILWVNRETGLPAGLALHTSPWGRARCVTRSLEQRPQMDIELFTQDLIPGSLVNCSLSVNMTR